MSSGAITHITKIGLSINNHHEMIPAFVTMLGGYHLTLGIPWLKHYDVKIDFASNSLTFESESCLKNCVNEVIMAYGIEEELPHFLRLMQHNVLSDVRSSTRTKYFRYFPNNTTNSFHYSTRKQKTNYDLTEGLITRHHCARDLSLLSDQYTVLAPLSYQPCTNGETKIWIRNSSVNHPPLLLLRFCLLRKRKVLYAYVLTIEDLTREQSKTVTLCPWSKKPLCNFHEQRYSLNWIFAEPTT